MFERAQKRINDEKEKEKNMRQRPLEVILE